MDKAGRAVCQTVGCAEAAQPWSLVISAGPIEIEVLLCRRHERDVFGARRVERAKAS